MATPAEIGRSFKTHLRLRTFPLGLHYTPSPPGDAVSPREPGQGCIMPLIFAAAKGKTAAFGPRSSGWPCSAFYLGFTDWIFPGIEQFLSCGPFPGRECERFVRTPQQVSDYLKSLRFSAPNQCVAVFKPLELFTPQEPPQVVIFFANPDQLSGLVFLLHFNAPEARDLVETRFASACAAAATLPLAHARTGARKAVWGMHDISARARLPRDLMTLAMPYFLLEELHALAPESFLATSHWRTIAQRSEARPGSA